MNADIMLGMVELTQISCWAWWNERRYLVGHGGMNADIMLGMVD